MQQDRYINEVLDTMRYNRMPMSSYNELPLNSRLGPLLDNIGHISAADRDTTDQYISNLALEKMLVSNRYHNRPVIPPMSQFTGPAAVIPSFIPVTETQPRLPLTFTRKPRATSFSERNRPLKVEQYVEASQDTKQIVDHTIDEFQKEQGRKPTQEEIRVLTEQLDNTLNLLNDGIRKTNPPQQDLSILLRQYGDLDDSGQREIKHIYNNMVIDELSKDNPKPYEQIMDDAIALYLGKSTHVDQAPRPNVTVRDIPSSREGTIQVEIPGPVLSQIPLVHKESAVSEKDRNLLEQLHIEAQRIADSTRLGERDINTQINDQNVEVARNRIDELTRRKNDIINTVVQNMDVRRRVFDATVDDIDRKMANEGYSRRQIEVEIDSLTNDFNRTMEELDLLIDAKTIPIDDEIEELSNYIEEYGIGPGSPLHQRSQPIVTMSEKRPKRVADLERRFREEKEKQFMKVLPNVQYEQISPFTSLTPENTENMEDTLSEIDVSDLFTADEKEYLKNEVMQGYSIEQARQNLLNQINEINQRILDIDKSLGPPPPPIPVMQPVIPHPIQQVSRQEIQPIHNLNTFISNLKPRKNPYTDNVILNEAIITASRYVYETTQGSEIITNRNELLSAISRYPDLENILRDRINLIQNEIQRHGSGRVRQQRRKHKRGGVKHRRHRHY
jgi:hypothetical protein